MLRYTLFGRHAVTRTCLSHSNCLSLSFNRTFHGSDLGHLCYVNNSPTSVQPSIKKKWSDFIVNEIDQDGNVVELHSFDIPDKNNKIIHKFTEQEKCLLILRTLIPKHKKYEQVKQFLLESQNPKAKHRNASILHSELNKFIRSQIFKVVSKAFPDVVVDTLEDHKKIFEKDKNSKSKSKSKAKDNQFSDFFKKTKHNRRFLTFRYKTLAEAYNLKSPKDKSKQKETSTANPSDESSNTAVDNETDSLSVLGNTQEGQNEQGEDSSQKNKYLSFVLRKSKMETTSCIGYLAKKFRFNIDRFGFAGTKDKLAISNQRCTVPFLTAEKLHEINSDPFVCHRLQVGDYRYVDKPIKLGELKGNRFVISLRKIECDKDSIDNRLANIRDYGFVNYFGRQRFGKRIGSHSIGAEILKQNFAECIDKILQSGPGISIDKPVDDRPKRFQKNKRNGLETNPQRSNVDNNDSDSDSDSDDDTDAESDDDTVTSNPVPISALAQLKTEEDVKRAISNIGKNGALHRRILNSMLQSGLKEYASVLNSVPAMTRRFYVTSYQSYVWNHMASARLSKHGLRPVQGDLVMGQDGVVKILADSEEAKKYHIFDVVLPMPGTRVQFPTATGVDQSAYAQFMQKDGITMESFSLSQNFQMYGDYRRLIASASDITWRVEHDDQAQVLTLQFSLSSSVYATMLLRELTQSDY